MIDKLKKNWVKYLPGLLVIPGIVIMFWAGTSMNYGVAFIGIVMAVGGFFYVYWQWNKPEIDKTKNKFKANTVVLTEKKLDFRNLENQTSIPWRNRNTGENQYFLTESKGDLEELVLPDDDDQVFYYSDEYYNVATMPSNKKYFAWSDTLFQKIAIGVLAVIIAGEFITLIVLA